MQQSMRLSILLFFICSVTLLQAIPAPSEKTSFRITILKSSGEPQPGIVLKIKNKFNLFIFPHMIFLIWIYQLLLPCP